ncbi:Nucleotidyltransferase [uncultured Gammaproteobacteria bacterium]
MSSQSETGHDGLSSMLATSAEDSVSPAVVVQQKELLLDHLRHFRVAADCVADALIPIPEVMNVTLFGSVAGPLWPEVPRFYRDRQAGGAKIWHNCADIDLAVWLTRLDMLTEIREACWHGLNAAVATGRPSIARHQLDVFILRLGERKPAGRLCGLARCPEGGRDCSMPHCGQPPLLQTFPTDRFTREALDEERVVRLFDRRTGLVRRAAELPVYCHEY